MVTVIKFDGRKEDFSRDKIIRTCIRVGASRERALQIAEKIEAAAYDGMSTREIYDKVKKELSASQRSSALVYGLRESVSAMDPVMFERFVKKLLEAHGYQCDYNRIISGLCVDHQVDVIARKDVEYLVECKRHNNPHRFCGLGVCLQVNARLEDIKDGYARKMNTENFARAWIITNTKFSEHAKRYSAAKNIKLTGWKYPDGESFEQMVDSKKLYPVTIIKARKDIIDKMVYNQIITIHDISGDSLSHACIEKSVAARILSQKSDLLK